MNAEIFSVIECDGTWPRSCQTYIEHLQNKLDKENRTKVNLKKDKTLHFSDWNLNFNPAIFVTNNVFLGAVTFTMVCMDIPSFRRRIEAFNLLGFAPVKEAVVSEPNGCACRHMYLCIKDIDRLWDSAHLPQIDLACLINGELNRIYQKCGVTLNVYIHKMDRRPKYGLQVNAYVSSRDNPSYQGSVQGLEMLYSFLCRYFSEKEMLSYHKIKDRGLEVF